MRQQWFDKFVLDFKFIYLTIQFIFCRQIDYFLQQFSINALLNQGFIKHFNCEISDSEIFLNASQKMIQGIVNYVNLKQYDFYAIIISDFGFKIFSNKKL